MDDVKQFESPQLRAEQLARTHALGAETVLEQLRPALLNADFATRPLT